MKNYYKGLTRYCYSCNTDVVGSICRQTGKATCPHVDEQVHKIYRHQKGTRNKRITKTFQTTSYEEAMALAIAWDKQRENNSAMPVFKNENITTKNEPTILQMSAKYYSFVRDENVPDHLKEGLDEAYTKDIGRALKTLVAQCPLCDIGIKD